MSTPLAMRGVMTEQLTAEFHLLNNLLDRLDREKTLLGNHDMNSLAALQDEKQHAVMQLRAMAEARDSLLNDVCPDGVDIFSRLAEIDPSGESGSAFRRNLDLARRCREANIENGIHINRREQFVRQSLAVITGETRQITYAADGRTRSGSALGQLGSA